MTGAKLRLVGTDEATSHEDLEQALDPERVAAVFVPAHLDDEPGALPLGEVAAVAHDHGVPTLVDAAFLNYPPASMRRFTEEGGDLVCFSAKYCYGPNTGGFVVGRSDLVDAVAVVDFTGFESGRWAIFGRPFKLDLHTIVGTVLAVEEWIEFDHEARWRAYAELVDELAGAVEGFREFGPSLASSPWSRRSSPSRSTAWSSMWTHRRPGRPPPTSSARSRKATRASPSTAGTTR